LDSSLGNVGREHSPGYLFFGEDTYPAYVFVRELRESLADPEAPPLERFDLAVRKWPEILDAARSSSLLFQSAQIILVESPPRKNDRVPSPHEKLTDKDKSRISAYFADPSPGTALVMIYPGKIRKSSPLVKFFAGLPARSIRIEEIRPVKGHNLASWVGRRFQVRGKNPSPDSVERLVELVGNDLRFLDNEVEKITTYVGDKDRISEEDVDQVSGWIKSYVEWELSEHLERADYRQCLLILHKLLEQDGVAPVRILALVSGFFRDVLLAKLRLKEGKKERKAIFSFFPRV
jgi:DNA polymerase III delta subunit